MKVESKLGVQENKAKCQGVLAYWIGDPGLDEKDRVNMEVGQILYVKKEEIVCLMSQTGNGKFVRLKLSRAYRLKQHIDTYFGDSLICLIFNLVVTKLRMLSFDTHSLGT